MKFLILLLIFIAMIQGFVLFKMANFYPGKRIDDRPFVASFINEQMEEIEHQLQCWRQGESESDAREAKSKQCEI